MEAFCEHCNKFTEHEVEVSEERLCVVGGEIVNYQVKDVKCIKCGGKSKVPKIENEISYNEHSADYKEGYKVGYDEGYREAKKKYC